jgi:hypothetical protein
MVFSSGKIAGILLGRILKGLDLLVTKDGVVIEVEFRIEGDDIPSFGDGQGVDLHLGAVLFDKEAIGSVKKTTGSAKAGRGKAEEDTDFAGLVGLKAEAGMNGFPQDGFGIFLRDGLDIHSALLTGNDDGATGSAVENDGQVKFAGDFGGFPDQNGVDRFTLGSRLMRDEGVANHVGRDVFDLPGGFDEMNTSLETVLEMAFAPPAGMDLGLDDEAVTRKAPSNRLSLFRGMGDGSTGNGDTRRSEKFPCLIFVDVHKSFVVKG